MASAAEKKRLREVLRRSLAASADDSQQCELGKEISANSLLTATVVESGRRSRLSLQLQSAERGCVEAAVMADWDPDQPAISVAEATSALLGKLRGETQLPWATQVSAPRTPSRPRPDRSFGGGGQSFVPDEADTTLVELRSNPAGAVVFVNGKLLCQDTSKGCSRMLPRGRATVRMEMERHLPKEAEVVVKDDLVLDWTLEANELRHDKLGTASAELKLEARKTTEVKLKLGGSMSSGVAGGGGAGGGEVGDMVRVPISASPSSRRPGDA